MEVDYGKAGFLTAFFLFHKADSQNGKPATIYISAHIYFVTFPCRMNHWNLVLDKKRLRMTSEIFSKTMFLSDCIE